MSLLRRSSTSERVCLLAFVADARSAVATVQLVIVKVLCQIEARCGESEWGSFI